MEVSLITISSNVVKIRKPRKCWGCTKEQPIGTQMNKCVTKDDDIVSAYWCSDCEKIIGKMEDWERQDGFEYGEFKHYQP